MSVWSKVKGVGAWIFNSLKSIIVDNPGESLESLKQIAIPIVEDIAKIDLNGDGRIATAKEIVDAAERIGGDFGKKLLERGKFDTFTALSKYYSENDLKRILALVRFAMAIINRVGINYLPRNRVLFGIIEVVVNEIVN